MILARPRPFLPQNKQPAPPPGVSFEHFNASRAKQYQRRRPGKEKILPQWPGRARACVGARRNIWDLKPHSHHSRLCGGRWAIHPWRSRSRSSYGDFHLFPAQPGAQRWIPSNRPVPLSIVGTLAVMYLLGIRFEQPLAGWQLTISNRALWWKKASVMIEKSVATWKNGGTPLQRPSVKGSDAGIGYYPSSLTV